MALVSQEVVIFDKSAADNIGCGRLGATQAEIEEAARTAYVHDFIMSLRASGSSNAARRTRSDALRRPAPADLHCPRRGPQCTDPIARRRSHRITGIPASKPRSSVGIDQLAQNPDGDLWSHTGSPHR